MLNWLRALLLVPLLVYGQNEEIIRVAVIWETNEFSYPDSKFKSSFMDGFYFFSQQLAKKKWSAKLGDPVDYKMEMHTFDSKFDSDKIRVDFLAKIGAGQNEAGDNVGPFHFMIGATAKKNKDIMFVGEQLGIPNIHASGGNPAMWWEHKEAAAADGKKHTYAFGMHLPFIGYTKPIIKAAAASGYKTVAILRPHGNFFQQTSAVAAVQWALDEKLEIIGPSKKWCDTYAADYTVTCKVIDGACRCIDPSEPPKLSKAEVTYDPTKVPTVYEIDEKKVRNGMVKDHVYPEFVEVYKGVWDDVAEQMKARGQDFVDVIVHWPVQYKSSVKAMKERGYEPQFFLGWNGGVSPSWSEAKWFREELTDETALEWTDGLHAFGFGQWYQALTYSDPFFQTDVAGILKIWDAEMNQGRGYDEFGACTTGIVLYLAVEKHLLKQDFVGATVADQRDALRVAVTNVAEETLWGFVQWNKYQQNSGGGVSTTVAWQLQPRGTHWDEKPPASTLVLPEAFAEGPYVKLFATWAQREGCSSVGASSPWVVEPAQSADDHAVCRNCDNYGPEISSPGLFVANNASTSCSLDKCPEGNFKLDAQTCVACSSGTFNALADQSKCTDCPVGFYQDQKGSLECKGCSDHSSTQRAGSSECVCVKGYFGQPGAGIACQKCPAMRTTANMDSRSIDECVCQVGSYAVFDEAGKVLRCSDKFCGEGDIVTDGTSKYRNEGLDCLGHGDLPTGAIGNLPATVRASFFIDPLTDAGTASEIGESAKIWRCLGEQYCPGGAIGSCGGNMAGTACVWCVDGYRKDTDTGICVECDGASPVVFGVVVAAVLLLMLLLRPMWNTNVLKQSTSTVVGITAVSIIGFLVMSIVSLGTYSVAWQEPVITLIQIANIFQFDLDVIQLQCVWNNNSRIAVYLIKVLMPALLMAVLVVFSVANHKKKRQPIDWPVIVNLLGMLFSFFFIAIAVLSVEPLRCAMNHPFGYSALDKQPDIVCSFDEPYGSEYGGLIGVSIVAMIFYVVTYLSLVAWAAWKHQSMVVTQNRFFIRSTRFLFFRWKNECYYWTCLWHARSLFVALVPIITASGSSEGGAAYSADSARGIIQIVLLITVMSLWGAEVSSQSPWRYRRLTHLDRFTTFLFVLMSLAASYNYTAVHAFVTIAVVLMFTFIFAFMGREVYEAKFKTASSKVDFFIAHHKHSTGLVARAVKAQIQYHSNSVVFLDTDSPDDYDQVTECARGCKNFVVLWSDAIASDTQCAIEIATAIHNQQNVIVMEMDSADDGLDLMRLKQIQDDWSDDSRQDLDAAGLEPAQITDAYVALKDAPRISYPSSSSAGAREEAIQSLIQQTNSRANKVPMLCSLPEGLDLFIAHDCKNAQASAAALVLKQFFRAEMRASYQVATSADFAAEKFPAALLQKCPQALVLLNTGVLADAQWAASVASLPDASNCKIVPVMIGMDFESPSANKLNEYANGKLDCDQSLVQSYAGQFNCQSYADKLRTMFKSPSLPLTSAASTNIVTAEAKNIVQRIRAGGRQTTMGAVWS
jgi:hypothetical protein